MVTLTHGERRRIGLVIENLNDVSFVIGEAEYTVFKQDGTEIKSNKATIDEANDTVYTIIDTNELEPDEAYNVYFRVEIDGGFKVLKESVKVVVTGYQ